MSEPSKQSTVRWTPEDLAVFGRIQALTGVSTHSDLIRMAVRSHLRSLERARDPDELIVLFAQRLLEAAVDKKEIYERVLYVIRTQGDARGIQMRAVYQREGGPTAEHDGYTIGTTSMSIVTSFSTEFPFVGAYWHEAASGRDVTILAYEGGIAHLGRHSTGSLKSWAETKEPI